MSRQADNLVRSPPDSPPDNRTAFIRRVSVRPVKGIHGPQSHRSGHAGLDSPPDSPPAPGTTSTPSIPHGTRTPTHDTGSGAASRDGARASRLHNTSAARPRHVGVKLYRSGLKP